MKAFQQSKTESLKTEEEAKFHQELLFAFSFTIKLFLGGPLVPAVSVHTDVNILLGLWDICFEKVYVL